MKRESESSLKLISSTKYGSHWGCSPPRHRTELHSLAPYCWVEPNYKFLLQKEVRGESEMSKPFSSTCVCPRGRFSVHQLLYLAC